MKKHIFLFCFRLFIFTAFILPATQCTIQKRTVNRGYFVQWHWKVKPNSKEVVKNDLATQDSVSTKQIVDEQETVTATISTEIQNSGAEISFIHVTDTKNANEDPEKTSVNESYSKKPLFKTLQANASKTKSKKTSKVKWKDKDFGIRVHTIVTVSLSSFLAGIIFIIRGLSANYITFAFIPGILFCFIGTLLFSIAILKLIIRAFTKNKTRPDKETRKKYQTFAIVESAIALITLYLVLLAKELL